MSSVNNRQENSAQMRKFPQIDKKIKRRRICNTRKLSSKPISPLPYQYQQDEENLLFDI